MIKFILFLGVLASGAVWAEALEDNSFLVEEAYNQEPGVVQFINVYQKSRKTHDWSYVFINEIPILSQDHQFSYEIPYSHISESDLTAIGDVKLNYRYQFFSNDMATITGRLSVISSSGDYKKGFGSGSTGYEGSLISSLKVADKWAQHWNFGAAITPQAKNSLGEAADNSKFFWNLSNVYFITNIFNFMLEISSTEEESTLGKDSTEWTHNTTVSPSFRYGLDVGDWQIVPGIAMPFTIGPNPGNDNQTLLYFSVEGKIW